MPALMKMYCSQNQTIPRSSSSPMSEMKWELRTLQQDMECVPELCSALQATIQNHQMTPVFHKQEMLFVGITLGMQLAGIGFDGEVFRQGRQTLKTQMEKLSHQAQRLVGHSFSMTSPDQIATVLFEDLNLPKIQDTNYGRSRSTNKTHHSTSERVLTALSKHHPLPALIIQHRRLAKTLTTYIDPMIKAATVPLFPPSQNRLAASSSSSSPFFSASSSSSSSLPSANAMRIYCSWNQSATGTGRLSSSHPNVQSLPRSKPAQAKSDTKREGQDSTSESQEAEPAPASGSQESEEAVGEEDAKLDENLRLINVRDAFCASDASRELIAADYSQMEMRILALVSTDTALQRVFSTAEGDVYDLMASSCFHIPLHQVSKQDRQKAKTISLGIVYGMGAANMANQLQNHSGKSMSTQAAQELIRSWHAKFHMVKDFMNRTVSLAKQTGYVCTLSNRKRFLPGCFSLSALFNSCICLRYSSSEPHFHYRRLSITDACYPPKLTLHSSS